MAYGLIGDLYDLAAACAVAVAQGQCYNDGYKRTAFHAMDAAFVLNGVVPQFDTVAVGQVIIRAAQRLMDEGEMAEWLRRNVAR